MDLGYSKKIDLAHEKAARMKAEQERVFDSLTPRGQLLCSTSAIGLSAFRFAGRFV